MLFVNRKTKKERENFPFLSVFNRILTQGKDLTANLLHFINFCFQSQEKVNDIKIKKGANNG